MTKSGKAAAGPHRLHKPIETSDSCESDSYRSRRDRRSTAKPEHGMAPARRGGTILSSVRAELCSGAPGASTRYRLFGDDCGDRRPFAGLGLVNTTELAPERAHLVLVVRDAEELEHPRIDRENRLAERLTPSSLYRPEAFGPGQHRGTNRRLLRRVRWNSLVTSMIGSLWQAMGSISELAAGGKT
jgi:hypothetical protein